jgi:hypothetical protein
VACYVQNLGYRPSKRLDDPQSGASNTMSRVVPELPRHRVQRGYRPDLNPIPIGCIGTESVGKVVAVPVVESPLGRDKRRKRGGNDSPTVVPVRFVE